LVEHGFITLWCGCEPRCIPKVIASLTRAAALHHRPAQCLDKISCMHLIESAPYSEVFAGAVASWATETHELEMWASLTAPVDATLLSQWSQAPGVSAFVFAEAASLCAYA